MDRDHGPDLWAEGARHADDVWWDGPLHLVLLVAALTLLVLGIVWLVRTLSRPATTATTAPPAPALDPALAELRLRYARGDVDRDAYLQSSADLTGRTGPWPGEDGPTADG